MISGNIAGTGSDTALIAAIAPASPRTSSLGSVVNDVLAQMPSLATLVVLLAAGTVSVGGENFSGGSSIATGTFEPTGVVKSLDEWRSSFLSVSGLDDVVMGTLTPTDTDDVKLAELFAEALDPAEVRLSIGGFVDALDRAFQTQTAGPAEVIIVINQNDQKLTISSSATAPSGVTGSVVATFTRTAATSPTAQWGE